MPWRSGCPRRLRRPGPRRGSPHTRGGSYAPPAGCRPARSGFTRRRAGTRPSMPDERADDLLDLLDFKREVADLYRRVRAAADPEAAWRDWRATRDGLFAGHPQSPLPPEERAAFEPLPYFDHDPAA